MKYTLNTSVSIIMKVETKVRLIELAQKQTIEKQANVTVSDLIRAGVEELLKQAEKEKGK